MAPATPTPSRQGRASLVPPPLGSQWLQCAARTMCLVARPGETGRWGNGVATPVAHPWSTMTTPTPPALRSLKIAAKWAPIQDYDVPEAINQTSFANLASGGLVRGAPACASRVPKLAQRLALLLTVPLRAVRHVNKFMKPDQTNNCKCGLVVAGRPSQALGLLLKIVWLPQSLLLWCGAT